ncbi:serine/threonine-kinase pknD domain protein [Mycobacterium xenopi 4042]|uniref:Serine/threonine-kinase pknD domain protein n=1 Tax=Mycobacterium xenopi 4042 TaxID=1299334 RepID=X8AHX5_MYCXE|nr:serine/threonine-kinase pknD domain protein [Mycobacterium xenopi 4042]
MARPRRRHRRRDAGGGMVTHACAYQPARVAAAPGSPPRQAGMLIGATALVIVAVIAAVAYLVLAPPHGNQSAAGQTVLPFNGLNFRLSPAGWRWTAPAAFTSRIRACTAAS